MTHTNQEGASLLIVDHPISRRLTPEAQEQALKLTEDFKRSQQEQLAARGGVPFDDSTEVLRQIRKERSAHHIIFPKHQQTPPT